IDLPQGGMRIGLGRIKRGGRGRAIGRVGGSLRSGKSGAKRECETGQCLERRCLPTCRGTHQYSVSGWWARHPAFPSAQILRVRGRKNNGPKADCPDGPAWLTSLIRSAARPGGRTAARGYIRIGPEISRKEVKHHVHGLEHVAMVGAEFGIII